MMVHGNVEYFDLKPYGIEHAWGLLVRQSVSEALKNEQIQRTDTMISSSDHAKSPKQNRKRI